MKKILTFILSISSIILLFSFNIENMVLSTMSTLVLNDKIASYMTRAVEDAYPIIDKTNLQKINEKINDSTYLNTITEKYFNNIINDILKNTVTAPDISNEVMSMVDENFKDYEYQYAVKKILNSTNYESVYTNILQDTKNIMSDEMLYLIHSYKLINNSITKVVCSIIIVLNTLLIILLSKPKYFMLKNFYISLSMSGIIQILMLLALKNLTMYSDIGFIVLISISQLVIGAILDTIYNKIDDREFAKLKARNAKETEEEEESDENDSNEEDIEEENIEKDEELKED